MANSGFWTALAPLTLDRLNAGLLQFGLDAAKPTAQHLGRLYYATDTDIWYYDDGSTWQVATGRSTVSFPPQVVIKSADESKSNDTSLATPDADLQITLAALTVYHFRAFLLINAPTAPDFQFTFNFVTGVTMDYRVHGYGPGHEANTQFIVGNDTYDQLIKVRGKVDVGSVGTGGYNFALKWAQNVADPAPVTLYKGSWLQVEQQ